MNSHPLNTNNQKNLPRGNQQDWREQPQQDWQEQPQQDWREQPQQDWQEQPQQDWREQPQQDWQEQLQQDWQEQLQQDWREQPQQDWQEQPQQDWQEQPQQDWREQPQQDWQEQPQQDWQEQPQQDWQEQPQQDWQEQPQQDWQEQPQQDWREQPQQDWQEQPQQDWQEQPQQDWREQPQQDWQEQPQQDWQEQPQQDWREQPQQDWQEQPQQDWREQPQQDSLQEMYPGSPLPGTSSTVRKTFHMDKGTTISASIAALLLIGGGILSYTFYDKGEKLLKRTSYLKSDISALADETALLQKKYEPVKQTAEALAQASGEAEQLQTSLESKKKEIEKIRQEHSPTLSRLNTIQQSITYREKEKKSRHNQKEALVKEISGLKEKIASLTTSPGPQPPPGEEQPGREINPASLQIDQKLFNQGTAYLMARQTGNIHYLSNIFALRCNYQYANGKDTDNASIMNDIQKFWIKWPLRSYRLLKVAYLRNAIELIYFYECTNHQGRRIRGYTKEMWKTSPSGQIIHWNEIINPKEAPDVTPGYRILQANH